MAHSREEARGNTTIRLRMVIGLLTVLPSGMAAALDWSTVAAVRTRSMQVHYQLAQVQPEDLMRIELWFRRGQEGPWQLYCYDEDLRSPVLFVAGQEGLYQFAVAVVDRWGRRSLTGRGNLQNPSAQLSVFVDYQKPQLYLYSPSKELRVFRRDTMSIRWGGFDANLGSRPVQLFYRSQDAQQWSPISGPLEAEGEFVWRIPGNLRGPFQIAAQLEDRVGHTDSQISGWISRAPSENEVLPGPYEAPPTGGVSLPAPLPAPISPESADEPHAEPPATPRLDDSGQAVQVISEASRREAERHFRSGIWYSQRREWEKAIQAFEKVIKLNPGGIEARVNLANAYFSLGKYEQSLQHYQQVLQADPERRTVLFNLAQTQVALKQFEKSFETLDRLAVLDRRDWQAWLLRGETARQLGNEDVALDSWQYVAHAGTPYFRAKAQALLENYLD